MKLAALTLLLLGACVPAPPFAGTSSSGDAGPDAGELGDEIVVRVRTHQQPGVPVGGARVRFADADGSMVVDVTADVHGEAHMATNKPLTVFSFEDSIDNAGASSRTIVVIPDVSPGQLIVIGNDVGRGNPQAPVQRVVFDLVTTATPPVTSYELVTRCGRKTSSMNQIAIEQFEHCTLVPGDVLLVLGRTASGALNATSRGTLTTEPDIPLPPLTAPDGVQVSFTDEDTSFDGTVGVLFDGKAVTTVPFSVRAATVGDVPYAYGGDPRHEVFLERSESQSTHKLRYARQTMGNPQDIDLAPAQDTPWIDVPNYDGVKFDWSGNEIGGAVLMAVTAEATREEINYRWRYLVHAPAADVHTFEPPIIPSDIAAEFPNTGDHVRIAVDMVRFDQTIPFAQVVRRADPALAAHDVWFELPINELRISHADSINR